MLWELHSFPVDLQWLGAFENVDMIASPAPAPVIWTFDATYLQDKSQGKMSGTVSVSEMVRIHS